MDLLRSFEVFQSVAELGSFSRAAEKLGIVPSAVSRQINELEDWAGLKLINRTTRSLHVTPEGQIYLEKLAHISAEVLDLRSLGGTKRELAGQLNITTPVMVGQYVMPVGLAKFKKEHPKVRLSMTLVNRVVDVVDEGYDVAIRAGQLPDSSLLSRTVGHVGLCTVASPDYLNSFGEPSHPKELTRHNCLISEPQVQSARWPFQENGKEIHVKVSGDMAVNDSICLAELAMTGHGIVRLPQNYVVQAIKAKRLVYILPDFAPDPMPITIIHNSGRRVRPTIRAFVDFISDEMSTVLK